MSRDQFNCLMYSWADRSPKLTSVVQFVLQNVPPHISNYAYSAQEVDIRVSFNALLTDIVSICFSEDSTSSDVSFRVEDDSSLAIQWQYEYQRYLNKIPIEYLLCVTHVLFDSVMLDWHKQSPLQERSGRYTYHYQALAAYHLFPLKLLNDLPQDELLVWYYQLTKHKVEQLQNRYLVLSHSA